MKKSWISYTEDWKSSPMAFWVHKEVDKKPWYVAEKFDPPAPKKHGSLGYVKLHIEFNGFKFIFTSQEQLNEFIEILGQKLLPTTIELSKKRSATAGPNGHWLSRMPPKSKSWKYREKLVEYCKKQSFPK